jgi:hypothetical protein
MADFYHVYCSIKNGTREESHTDFKLKEKILSSSSFEDFLGDGIYLTFDGSTIQNPGGNKGHINPFDAGTQEAIRPERLKVCILKDLETGEISYSKYDYAFYLMANLTEADKEKLGTSLLEKIAQFQQDHPEIAEKFSKRNFSEEIISMDEFQAILKSINEKKISISKTLKNAIPQGITLSDIKKIDNLERPTTKDTNNISIGN